MKLATKFFLLVFAFAPIHRLCADPLATARTLKDSTYKDWTYGSKASDKQVDCVQFVKAVLDKELKTPLNAEQNKAVLIAHNWTETETQQKAADGTDKKIQGVHYALVDLAQAGISVKLKEAKAGDFVQYWMIKKKAKPEDPDVWSGHSGVIASVAGTMATLISADPGNNASDKGGVRESKKLNLIEAADRRIYLVRLK